MSTLSRRAFVACSLIGSPALLSACGGGGGGGTEPGPVAGSPGAVVPERVVVDPVVPEVPPPAAVDPPAWNLSEALSLLTDGSNRFDLAATLPDGIKPGGRFSVSPAGAALPDGVLLTAAGWLSAAAGARIGPVEGVVFAYDEP